MDVVRDAGRRACGNGERGRGGEAAGAGRIRAERRRGGAPRAAGAEGGLDEPADAATRDGGLGADARRRRQHGGGAVVDGDPQLVVLRAGNVRPEEVDGRRQLLRRVGRGDEERRQAGGAGYGAGEVEGAGGGRQCVTAVAQGDDVPADAAGGEVGVEQRRGRVGDADERAVVE